MASFSKLLLNIWIVFFFTQLSAQKEDNQWLFGFSSAAPFYDENGVLDTTLGITKLDFDSDPPRLNFDIKLYSYLNASNAIVCDEEGKSLVYSNGMQVFSGRDRYIIEDTIAYGLNWEDKKSFNDKGEMITSGFRFINSSLIIPLPGSEHLYYLFYLLYDITPPDVNDFHTRYFYNALIDMSPGNGPGKVVYKDHVMVGDSLFMRDSLASCGLAACRHANGRDWWLVLPAKYQNKFYTYLVDPGGIHFQGIQESGERFDMGLGQVCFSPDGRRMAANSGYKFTNDGAKVIVLDFDRRTGKISHGRSEHIPAGYGVSHGLAFSPDSRYMYASNDKYIYQYDLYNPDVIGSRRTVATYDGYLYVYPGTTGGRSVSLGWMGLAPDGRIYISAGSGTNRKMGVMHYPNDREDNCDVRQHSLHITTSYGRTMPNYPNYRLGPWDGSYCDTLGLDNHPVAKYRYEQDTVDYLKVRFTDLSYYRPESWHWDFGDGTTTSERSPRHTYAGPGAYEVCLTVSNENSSNTLCRTLYLGTSSTTGPDHKKIEVSLYPNPVQDELILTIYDYLPRHGMVHIYDMAGRRVLSGRVYHGRNGIDMGGLLPGAYVYWLEDGDVMLKNGKVIKVE